MPFFVINAVLAIVSIVGGLTLYHELQATRAALAIVERHNAECEAARAAAVRNWHLCGEHLVQAQQERDHYHKLWSSEFQNRNKLQKFRNILTRHSIEWHEEPGIVLEIAP
jgi:hypothetical protein